MSRFPGRPGGSPLSSANSVSRPIHREMAQDRPSLGRLIVAGTGRVICLFSYVYAAAWLAIPFIGVATHNTVPWKWFAAGMGIALVAWLGGRSLVRVGHRT